MELKKKKIIILAAGIVAALLLAAALLWFFVFRNSTPTNPDEMVQVVSVSDLTGNSGAGMVTRFSGLVEPQKTLSIQKDSSKKVDELFVAVGQEVAVGDKLFNYDTEDLGLQLQEAQLQLDSLKNQISTLNQQIESLQKEKNNAPADDQLSYTLQIQSVQLEIRTAEYDISTKAKEIELLQKSIQNSDVVAEMAGVVKEINESGTNADGSEAAFITILATGQYRVKATATEFSIMSLQEGMPIVVTSRVDNTQTWSGKIDKIEREPTSDNNNRGGAYYGSEGSFTTASKYNFYVLLDSFDGLMLGQHVYVEPDYGTTQRTGIWLPSFYLTTEDQTSYIWCANDNNRIEKREVSLGKYDENTDEYEILSGISYEDRIAAPTDNIKAGMYATGGMADGSMDGGMDGSTDGGMDGSTDGAMDGSADDGMVDDGAEGGTMGGNDSGIIDAPADGGAVILGGAVG